MKITGRNLLIMTPLCLCGLIASVIIGMKLLAPDYFLSVRTEQASVTVRDEINGLNIESSLRLQAVNCSNTFCQVSLIPRDQKAAQSLQQIEQSILNLDVFSGRYVKQIDKRIKQDTVLLHLTLSHAIL